MTSDQIQKETNLDALLQRLHYPSPADPLRKQERRLLRRKISRFRNELDHAIIHIPMKPEAHGKCLRVLTALLSLKKLSN